MPKIIKPEVPQTLFYGNITNWEFRNAITRDKGIFQLKSRSFIPFSYTVQQYFDYWLYYYCLDKKNLNYNSFYSYRNVMYSYLLPKLSGNMTDITIDQLVSAMRSIDKISVKKQSLGVVSGIFKQAVNERVISFNLAVYDKSLLFFLLPTSLSFSVFYGDKKSEIIRLVAEAEKWASKEVEIVNLYWD